MIRSWGLVVLTGAAQPWFSSLTTAAIALPADATGIILVTVSVADSKKFQAGDRILVEPGTANEDILLVGTINTTTGVLSCTSEGNAATHTHASGVLLALSIACMDVIIQTNAAAAVWLGSDNTVTAGGGSAFYQMAATPTTPFRYTNAASSHNVVRTSDGWMIGTGTQAVGVAAVIL
jgi:hypothetical protein